MLVVAQAGEAGKTKYLFDMHRLRKRVFFDRMQWSVRINENDLEIDQFDIPEAIYILSVDNEDRVVGSWRLLPTTGPTMIRNVWPHFLDSIFMPSDKWIWECSRFAVDSLSSEPTVARAQIHKATKELFCGVAELCVKCGIEALYAMHDISIIRIAEKVGCTPHMSSIAHNIDGKYARVSAYQTNLRLLNEIRKATSISTPLISNESLPPTLVTLVEQKERFGRGFTNPPVLPPTSYIEQRIPEPSVSGTIIPFPTSIPATEIFPGANHE